MTRTNWPVAILSVHNKRVQIVDVVIRIGAEEVGFTEHRKGKTLKVVVEKFDDFVVTATLATGELLTIVGEDVVAVVYLLLLHFFLVDPY
jgi:hypothetical protein